MNLVSRPLPAGLLLVCLSVAVYWPGLGGGFVFDDYQVIVNNEALALTDLSVESLLDAVFSAGATGPLMRPLAMLSFAFNRAWSGLDPRPYKITNVAVHALNALLVLVLLRVVTPLLAALTPAQAAGAAWLAAALWALHPLNLTSVLYVVQRMTALSSTFMLAALCIYASARSRQLAGVAVARAWWVGVCACGVAAVLVKETALALPLYIYVLEACAFRFRANRWLRPLFIAIAVAGVVALLVLLLQFPGALFGGYAARDFTPAERLWTEGRVLLFYLRLLVLPAPAAFSVFHDDIALSHGWLAPPATLLAALALLAMLTAAGYSARRYVAFGVLWFLLGHVLESSIYPLELVHEHRNYLPVVGMVLLLVLSSRDALARVAPRARLLLALLALVVIGATTATRAALWSHADVQIEREAALHPASARSQYEAGRVRVTRARASGDAALRAAGIAAFERAAALGPTLALPLSALLKTAIEDDDVAAIKRLLERVRMAPRAAVRADVLQQLIFCQAYGSCTRKPDVVRDLAAVVLDSSALSAGGRRYALKWLAIYYLRVLADGPAGTRILADLVAEVPQDYRLRARYAEALNATGQVQEGVAQARLAQAALPWHSRVTERALRRQLQRLLAQGESGAYQP